MASLISAISGLIVAIALLLFAVGFLRLSKPIGQALMRASNRDVGERLEALSKLLAHIRTQLPGPGSEDS
jgi:uncharacterized protein YoxC